MDFYPVFMNLRGRRVLVIGGGEVAARKVDLLHSAGGRIVVVSPQLGRELAVRRAAGDIEHVGRRVVAGDVPGAALVVCASDDERLHGRV